MKGQCPICLGQNRSCTRVYKNLKNHMVQQHGARPDPMYVRQQRWRAKNKLTAFVNTIVGAFGDK
jgi:hypothetical protein